MFTGFPSEARTFFAELAESNSKAWFDAHRDVYERAVRLPLEDLVDEAQERYGPGKVFRPNRDVRFSTDKSPFKVNGAMVAGDVAAVYVSVGAAELHVGGGLYQPSRDQLARARERIAERPKVAQELRAALDPLLAQGFELAGPSLKTAPRGYDREHPEIELLRLKHFAALRALPVEAAREDVLGGWRAIEPLLDWIRFHVGPAQQPPDGPRPRPR